MSNKSHEERVAQSKRNAAKEIAKKGVLQLRIEPAILEEIFNLATARRVRYTDMVRDWIVFELQKAKTGIENPSELDVVNLAAVANDMLQQMSLMRVEIDQLKANQQIGGIDWGIAQTAPITGIRREIAPPPPPGLRPTFPPPHPHIEPPRMPGVDPDWYPEAQSPQAMPVIQGEGHSVAPSAQQSASAELSGIVLVKNSNESTPKVSKEQLKRKK